MIAWRTIGVLGGMGPAATVDFLGRLVAGANAPQDTAHPRVLIDSDPQIPDRNAARAGGPSPGPALAAMARGLVAQGARVLAMPCNAAHGWADDIRAAAGEAQFIDMVEATADAAAAAGARAAAVLAVDATLDSRLYHRALEARGIAVLEPDRPAVRALVARVKAGERGPALEADAAALVATFAGRATHVILACTELPLALNARATIPPVLDATAILAAATLRAARL
jgi:aspartate racemase